MRLPNGGGCRATNPASRSSVRRWWTPGHPEVLVISVFRPQALTKTIPASDFSNLNFLIRAVYGLLYGDLIMQLLYRVRPWRGRQTALRQLMADVHAHAFVPLTAKVFTRCASTPWTPLMRFHLRMIEKKPRVGVVGEILVTTRPPTTSWSSIIEAEGCVTPMYRGLWILSVWQRYQRH